MPKKTKSDELGDPSTDVSTRLAKIDHDWLLENRGSKSVREKVHEIIEFYKKHRGGTT